MSNSGVSLWLADCAATTGRPWEGQRITLLHENERQRYHALIRHERRRQFLMGHVLLRHALGALLDRPPGGWRINDCPGRAPRLESNTQWPVTFSLAHSCDRVACLLTGGKMAGVDIEHTGRRRDLLGIAAYCFHPENVRQLEALKSEEQVATFYRLWTLREAALKACSGHAGLRTEDLPGWDWTPEPVFATTVLGEYSLAVAIDGDVPFPGFMRKFRPDGTVELHESVIWEHYRVEWCVREGSFTPFFAPRPRPETAM